MKFKSLLVSSAVLSVMLTGCIDDSYDLSDIDTTAELKVKDLVLPLNIDDIVLSDIFDLEDNSRIKVVNGEYVIIEEGSFNSDEISIPDIHADAPEAGHTVKYLELEFPDIHVGYNGEYLLTEDSSKFKYEFYNISNHITALTRINLNLEVVLSLELKELKFDEHLKVEYRDLLVKIPKGLTIKDAPGNYDPTTGQLYVALVPVESNIVKLDMRIESIDLEEAGVKFDAGNHSMLFEDEVSVVGGKIIVETDDVTTLPHVVTLVKDCTFSEVDIEGFSGSINYPLENIDIAPISLDDLPSVLNQEGTDISIVNPQIYLSINNPVASYKVVAQTGLTLTAYRPSAPQQEYSLDNEYFTIGYENGTAPLHYCLSPKVPSAYYAGYENASHVAYTSLSDVLSGNGLPSSIGVTLNNPCIPNQQVEDFRVGVNLGKATGEYTFYCPLALNNGAVIVYRDVIDGWNDEDVDAIAIEELEVAAEVSTDLPVGIKLVGYPIDVHGNKINNVDIEGAEIEAEAKNKSINIRVTGEIKHLDGISFEAKAVAGDSEATLKPTQNITLKNIKVKVSGSYIKEL